MSLSFRSKVMCGSYAMQKQMNGFRLIKKAGGKNITCELLDMKWSRRDELGEEAYIDASIPPVDSVWTAWSASNWSACTEPCDTGSQVRIRYCSTPMYRGAWECMGTNQQTQQCNTQACPS